MKGVAALSQTTHSEQSADTSQDAAKQPTTTAAAAAMTTDRYPVMVDGRALGKVVHDEAARACDPLIVGVGMRWRTRHYDD